MERLPAGRDASAGGGVPPYVRHRPERTLLYQVVRDYYPAFKAHLAAQGAALPGYIEQEFEDYLKCGRLQHGFLRVRATVATPSTWWPSAANAGASARAAAPDA